MRDKWLIARRIDEKMHMRRPHRMAPDLQDHFPHGSIGRDRITAGQNSAKEKPAIGIGDKPRPGRRSLRLIGRLLRIVKAVIVGVPNIDRNARQRFALEIGDAALHKHPFARQSG